MKWIELFPGRAQFAFCSSEVTDEELIDAMSQARPRWTWAIKSRLATQTMIEGKIQTVEGRDTVNFGRSPK